MSGKKMVSTVGMSREEWLERRKDTIGGSDAAAIIGLSKWASPYTVWADKVGLLPDKEDSEAMRQGRDLEEYVAKRFEEATGKRVRRRNAMLYNELYPWAHADVDRMVVAEDAGLECKTTSDLHISNFKGVEFPERYYAQCVHYMAVTGAKRWYLAVLVFGRGFFTYTLERDQDEIDALMAAEKDFWRYVENNEAPPADGADATGEALDAIYDKSDDSESDLFGFQGALAERSKLKLQEASIQERIKEIDNKLKAHMGDASIGTTEYWKVTWKPQTRQTFQVEAFKKDHPEIDLKDYYKTSTYRTFKVTEAK